MEEIDPEDEFEFEFDWGNERDPRDSRARRWIGRNRWAVLPVPLDESHKTA
jgi:hypothetical protein